MTMSNSTADPAIDPAATTDPVDPPTTDPAPTIDPGTDPDGTATLGDPGKKALDEMKGKWHAERDRRKALEAEVTTLKTPKQAEGETPTLDQLREQAKAEALAETLRERALDKIEAKAARLVKDPALAAAMLRDKVDSFVDDGKVDADAISEAITELVKQYPYLGITQGDPTTEPPKRFTGGSDAGPKGTPGKAQLTKAQLDDLFRQGKHGEIEALRKEGRLNTLLGIT